MSDLVDASTLLSVALENSGYGGLFNAFEPCGCKLGDLAPCGAIDLDSCCAGYVWTDEKGNWRIGIEPQGVDKAP